MNSISITEFMFDLEKITFSFDSQRLYVKGGGEMTSDASCNSYILCLKHQCQKILQHEDSLGVFPILIWLPGKGILQRYKLSTDLPTSQMCTTERRKHLNIYMI